MANIRHVVVIRKDLALPVGLAMAQAAHASDHFLRLSVTNGLELTEIDKDWCKDPYLSVLAVNNGEELEVIHNEAAAAGLRVHLWWDTIPSEILQRPIKVMVGISIGPDDFDRIKLVTGTLPLY